VQQILFEMSTKQFNPATGEQLSSVPNTPPDRMPIIFEKARRAQKAWAQLPFKQRAAHVLKVKGYLAANAERIAAVIASCNGKTRQDALATEVLPCVMACDWYAKNTAIVLKPQKLPCGNILFANKTNVLEYTPLGVVGIISPWNYPFSIPFGEIIMGLMAGNAIVLKVATPTTLVGEAINECMAAGGFPDGLFTHVVLSGAEVSPLMLANGVDKIFFTGSVKVGKQLMAEAAKTLTPLSLELGGKDPMIVLADADIERAVNCALWAGFQNAGQSCGGVERVYVHESIYDKFLAQLVSKTKALRHGVDVHFNVDIGSITTKGQLDTIVSQVNDAVKAGARIVAQSQAVGDVARGFFYPATVLTHVNHTMRIMREENFGPVVPVMSFVTVEEAVALANDCTMALTSSVFSNNKSEAKRVASMLESGVVTINDHLYSHGLSEAPWGGWKESGLGRTHGYLGLKEMSNVRCVNDEMLPSGWIPRNMWWYPFSRNSYEGLLSAVRLLCPESVGQFVASAAKLTKFAVGTMFYKWKVPDTAPSSLSSVSEKKGPQTPRKR
jgi:succinate-semialdehyde dehydrogenase/glutarate-semialdehyde dehydrogenase